MRIHVKPRDHPQRDFTIEEINAMLAFGDLDGDELAWRPGLPDWIMLRELKGIAILVPPPLLEPDNETVRTAPTLSPLPSSESTASIEAEPTHVDESKTFLGGATHPWRRFFARTVDVTTLGLALLIGLVLFVGLLFPENAAGLSAAIENPMIAAIILYLLWIPCEAISLAFTGTTPAKWLFGIRVIDASGAKLSFGSALQRSFLVFLQGEGLGIPVVTLFTRVFAYRRLTKTGTTLWDASVNSIVTHRRWGFFRALFCVIVVIAVLMFLSILNDIGNEY